MTKASELMDISLPKWPQMLVTGKSVTTDQAKEIILRTDWFPTDICCFSGGNFNDFNKDYRQKSGMDDLDKQAKKDHDSEVGDRKIYHIEADKYDTMEKIKDRLGIIDLSYITNDWCSSSVVYGPNGWCSPKGIIHYDKNVGKWPSIDDLLDEWSKVAEAFPYLDLHVTLMSDEYYCDDLRPLVNIRVVDGKAVLQKPDISVHGKLRTKEEHGKDIKRHLKKRRKGKSAELGLPKKWYNEYAKIVKKAIKEVLKEKKS